MIEIVYKTGAPENFDLDEKQQFLSLLIKQGRLKKIPNMNTIERCKLLCLCKINHEIVSIGAIKNKSRSDFGNNKADVGYLNNFIDWELGYCFTTKEHQKQGHSSRIIQILINQINSNLIATTEIGENNSMKHILEKCGFKHYGKVWESSIDKSILGLFFRWK